jgi:paraquat-inducible protein A
MAGPTDALPALRATARRLLAPFLLVSALLLYAFGIFFPFFTVTKLWVFRDAVSVVGGLGVLFQSHEYFLFAILTLFTLIFPVVKLGLLGVIWLEREQHLARVRRLHHRVESLGKWSMLDVFVVAILVVTMKSAAIGQIRISVGLYLFTFSVLFTQFATVWIEHLLREA